MHAAALVPHVLAPEAGSAVVVLGARGEGRPDTEWLEECANVSVVASALDVEWNGARKEARDWVCVGSLGGASLGGVQRAPHHLRLFVYSGVGRVESLDDRYQGQRKNTTQREHAGTPLPDLNL